MGKRDIIVVLRRRAWCGGEKVIIGCKPLSQVIGKQVNSKTAGCRFDSCPTCPKPKPLRKRPERFLLWSFLCHILENRRSGHSTPPPSTPLLPGERDAVSV